MRKGIGFFLFKHQLMSVQVSVSSYSCINLCLFLHQLMIIPTSAYAHSGTCLCPNRGWFQNTVHENRLKKPNKTAVSPSF